MTFPEPVISVAIEPKTQGRPGEAGRRARRLAQEDPTFRVRTDEETAQTIISGMGELHLEIIVDRLLREFKVDANVGKPQVAYRETIRASGEAAGQVRAADRRPRPVRPRVHRGRAARRRRGLRVREQDRRRRRFRGSTSRRSRRASRKRMETGVLAGYPMVDIKVPSDRRLVPRRRLVGDGLQDRRLDGVQGGRAARPSPSCWSRSWTSRWSRPRSSWATSSATSTAAAAASSRMEAARHVRR